MPLHDPTKTVIVQTTPAVRAGLGEEFTVAMGTSVTGKMAASLEDYGIWQSIRYDFGADVCMEEGTVLIGRVTNGGVLPMITSCSPGWIKFIETYYPKPFPTCPAAWSPQNITGALLKNHYAQANGIDPRYGCCFNHALYS